MRPEDLSGDAREMYEAWRGLGLSETRALAEVAGMDGAPQVEPFDELASAFRSMGLSEGESRAAAVGRDGSESQARRLFAEAVRPGTGSAAPGEVEQRRALAEAVRAAQRFHGFDAERAEDWVRRKYEAEWVRLPLAEAVRELRAYARMLEAAPPLSVRSARAGLDEGRAAGGSARAVELREGRQ